ncbi:hypothetical protein MtrunA17_Chr4g0027741 [Medicago truncatula]|uniref:VQ domain-containing protein n=1 Tax=Medicago truncatula TaxID=3880 RepID=A0A396I7C9_MEDTR|nr:protein HAIKU1-like [Medicago truncatula]RHN60613.1 hypothetical protein MtrunA17_Chr4g0027741 [Medicago truncatula]
MENFKKHNENLSVNNRGKNIGENYFQHKIDFDNEIITTSRNLYPYSNFYEVHRDEFKSFIQHITGNQSNSPKPHTKVTRLQKNRPPPLSIVRPPISVQVPDPLPPSTAPYNTFLGHHVQSFTGPPLVNNLQNNLDESSISAFMRNFQESNMSFDNSEGNHFQPYPHQPQLFNNINVQYQPITQSQEYYYPMNGSDQLVTGSSSTQKDVSNLSVPFNLTNPTFPMNDNNHILNGFPSSQTNGLRSITSEFLLPSLESNMDFLSPQSPYSPQLSPSLFSLLSSPEYPFYPYLQNGNLFPDPPSPLSSSIFPSFTNSNRPDNQ